MRLEILLSLTTPAESRVTFSAGVAASRGRTAPELVGAAEVLLQRAKASGRGAVEIEANIVGVSARR